MFLIKKLKPLILLSALLLMILSIPTSNVLASTKTKVDNQKTQKELERLFSSKSSHEEKSAFAKSRDTSGSITVNEFDLCKSSDKRLGILPNQDGSKVKAYLEKIEELSKKNKSELEAMGFSDTRIKNIQNVSTTYFNTSNVKSTVDPTTNIIALALGASCDVYQSLDGYYYDTAYAGVTFKTQAYVTSSWRWDSAPIFVLTDGFAVGWDSATNLQLYKTFDAAEYCIGTSATYFHEVDYSYDAFNDRPALNGASFNFPQGEAQGDGSWNHAKTGYSMNVLVSTDFHVGSFSINTMYAHTHGVLNPSFGVSASGGIDAGFGYEETSTTYNKSDFFRKSDFIEY